MTKIYVRWEYCKFNSLYIPSDENLQGVYMIWDRMSLYVVNSGYISKELREDLEDEKINVYVSQFSGRVIYAEVPDIQEREGLRCWLIDKYNPMLHKGDLEIGRVEPEDPPFDGALYKG